MEQITLLGRKRKEGTLVSEFEPQESDEIMLNLIKRIRNVLESDIKELREHDGDRPDGAELLDG